MGTSTAVPAQGAYIPATDVVSPRRDWQTAFILRHGTDGSADVVKDGDRVALALGFWKGKRVLATRWNGYPGHPLGTPQARGNATWYIIGNPSDLPMQDLIVQALPPEQRKLAEEFLSYK